MPRRAVSSLVSALPLLVVLPACFDVTKVDPGPFYIDSFEGPDPRATRFGRWQCDTFTSGVTDGGMPTVTDGGAAGGGGQQVSCERGPVGDHPAALTARFDLLDPFDGTKQSVGVVVSTKVSSGSVDLSGFEELVFSGILESGTPALPIGTQLTVEIGCELLLGGPTVSQIVAGVNIGSDWARFRLPVDDFLPGPACLLQANSIRFVVRPGLRDGLPAQGSLSIDDLFLLL